MARSKLNTDDIEHFVNNDLYVPTRTVWIGSDEEEQEISMRTMERAIKNLHILDSKSDEPIEILLASSGGDVESAIAIFDAILLCRSFITIKVLGYAYSAAAFILQAADDRVISPAGKIMIHYGEAGVPSNHPKSNKKTLRHYDKLDDFMKKTFLEKIREKHPSFREDKLDRMLDFDTYLTAEEAVEIGLADKVMAPAKGHSQDK